MVIIVSPFSAPVAPATVRTQVLDRGSQISLTTFFPLQRLHCLPSDTRVWDLKFRFRCRKCNGREFEVTVEELRTGG